MRISSHGVPVDEPEIRAGFIGCGSHSFRNIVPAFQFAPVRLAATCDLKIEKARAFAAKFGAAAAYDDHRAMIEKEDLDAVFIVTGCDELGRPLYPRLAIDCLEAGRHVWIEKPPAASCEEVDAMQAAAARAGKNVVVGLKKMFSPANEKARELMSDPGFGRPSLILLQYPQSVPTVEEFYEFNARSGFVFPVTGFLDHLCHPMSLLVYLAGMPSTLFYERSASGAGVATFRYDSGLVASLALTSGASLEGGMERTTIVSDRGLHIEVQNNIRVTLRRTPPPMPGTGYGSNPNFFAGTAAQTSSTWEPEFSLGQLYNKGLFLLGYWGEVNEFARSILESRPPAKATLEHARQVTRVFEAFSDGPGRTIAL